ncbi:hypothetical protein K501DRAFT_169488 [Backusella circina FSU 941]|nr:hypothetical protein K501DRAFT_169488 [Backusella circina FSU 941]
MLNPNGNYIHQLADPDINLDWDTIEQVLISSVEDQSCPICLSPPTAARVTKCGHIFCLPCILHYLALRENPKKQWRKCPICWESIYEADLKSVRIIKPYATTCTTTSLSEGDTVEMCLIQRENQSTLAFPLSSTWPLPPNVTCQYIKPDVPLIPWHFSPNAIDFARFMLTSPDYMEGEYNRDCLELSEMLADAKGWGSVDVIPYIEKSEASVFAKIKEIKSQNTKRVELAMRTMELMFEAVEKYSKKMGKLTATEAVVHTNEEDEGVPEAYLQSHQGEMTKGKHQHQNVPTTDFYFYQAVDGQHIYLHPLDIRILKYEFGDYEKFPRQIEVKVTSVQESTLTEDLRKRCKYLGHLPLGCDVTFLEINVRDIVSPETVKAFNNELGARIKKRKDKERREDQKQKQAENQQKIYIEQEQQSERERMANDPFFNMYRPHMTEDESEEQLQLALSESSSQAETGPRTVWGTRQVSSREEDEQSNEWADHIVITKNNRKRRNKKH